MMHDRRHLLSGLLGVGAVGLLGLPRAAQAEPPPEVTTVRLAKFYRSICEAPKDVSDALLMAEGFTEVSHIEMPVGTDPFVEMANGAFDFHYDFASAQVLAIDSGLPLTVLAGLHAGCLELIGNATVKSVTDLKGRRLGTDKFLSHPHVLVSLMMEYIGLDSKRDVEWVVDDKVTPYEKFLKGEIDAFLALPPEPQELRARGVGRTILATVLDRPWAQQFCCMLSCRTEYAQRYPITTKRVLRAILKSVDQCAADPAGMAKRLAASEFTDSADFALAALKEIRFDVWRDFDPEDTLRFYTLRMREAGLIKSSPQEILAKHTDWRFLEELKRELKT
jgi:NitT/TauT family transport system substrate-binding protein